MNHIFKTITLLTISILIIGCSDGLEMDYGKPAAQFLEKDVSTKGKSYVGKKITIKGIVTKVDLSNNTSAKVHLSNGIVCNFGKFKTAAESYKVGNTLYVDGILKHCKEGDILLSPAFGRDPQAKFAAE